MTDEEILRRAIDKAVENHWLDLNLGLLSNDYICMLDGKIHILGAFKHFISYSLFEIIFSHSFAKAFWGDDEIELPNPEWTEWLPTPSNYLEHDTLPAWQYHLQQMVLSKKPLQYLAKSLEESKNE